MKGSEKSSIKPGLQMSGERSDLSWLSPWERDLPCAANFGEYPQITHSILMKRFFYNNSFSYPFFFMSSHVFYYTQVLLDIYLVANM